MRATQINPALLQSLRTTLALRAGALSDLRSCTDPEKELGSWGQDRVNEVRAHNRWIAATARRLGLDPAEFVGLAD